MHVLNSDGLPICDDGRSGKYSMNRLGHHDDDNDDDNDGDDDDDESGCRP